MTALKLRQLFLEFFKKQGHTIIPSVSLIPENDPTVLFTTAGMHPLIPFLLGEKYPGGKRLVNVQPCIRTNDIDEVGDETHHTFFEMLGNWSLGDYFKEETIKWSLEFLTSSKWLGLKQEDIAISIFEGDKDAERDDESETIWRGLGIPEKRIKALNKAENWWGPAGETGPCGPDTEMFYWVGEKPAPGEFDPEDKRWVEIWNDVFMEYYKTEDGKYEPLSQKNVDTGMGLERMLAAINKVDDDYKTDLFLPIIKKIEELSARRYNDNKREFRIIADHIKAAIFIIGDKNGVEPSNIGQGYVVRRLIRRAIRYGKILKLPENFLPPLIKQVVDIYKDAYPQIKSKEVDILTVIQKEEEKFEATLEKALKEFEKVAAKGNIKGEDAFHLYDTYGLPLELTEELAKEKGLKVDAKEFEESFKKHQELSQTASAGMFKGGLADAGDQAIKYHTATHLLLAALKEVLGEYVMQKGSNITGERLRFDFFHRQKMTKEEIKKVEDIVNQKIKDNLSVIFEETNLDEAKKQGAVGVFENRYGEKVKIYTVKDSSGKVFSKEICGGPHVENTGELGEFEITKEESSSSGIRRIRAILK